MRAFEVMNGGNSFMYSSDHSTRGAFFFPLKKTFSLFIVHEQIFTHNVESNCPFHKATHGLSRSSAQWSRTCARDKKGRTPSPVGGNGRNGWPRSPFILQTSASWRGAGLDMGRRLHFKCYVSKCKYATYVCQQIRSRHLIFKKRRRRPAALWRNVGQNV